MLSSQSSRKLRPELIAPMLNRFVASLDTPLRQQVFDIAMTQTASMVEPDGILDNFRRESVTFMHFRLNHAPDSGRLGVNLSVPTTWLLDKACSSE